MTDARSRLIVALDVPDRPSAFAAVDRLAGHVGVFKVGLELFVREGPDLVQEIRDRGEKVFLDLKLHDIPNTVAGAVRSAGRLEVQMLTVHASGGPAMLAAAAEAAGGMLKPPLLLAVTALTSLSPEDAGRIGVQGPIGSWVETLATLAASSGIRGLVCSPSELTGIRRKLGASVRIVVPGIRPSGTDAQDQARTSTPAEAILAGADYLVVGRPILRASDPAEMADRVVGEIAQACGTAPGKVPG